MIFEFFRGKKWSIYKNSYATGNVFYKGNLLGSDRLAKFFDEIDSEEELISLVKECNGFFAGLTQIGNSKLVLITDHIQSTPLFYTTVEGKVIVSDNANRILTEIEPRGPENIPKYEYLITRFVTGRDTLEPDIKQSIPGELTIFDESGERLDLKFLKYHDYWPEDSNNYSKDELVSDLEAIVTESFHRLIKRAGGRTIAVSLSAGYDSRLAALMLAKLKYENVILFTYESKNDEREASSQFVKKVGLNWKSISFSHQEMESAFERGMIDEFIAAIGYLGSIPGIGRVPPMSKGKENGIIPPNSIIVTGSGAMSTGEHIPKSFTNKNKVNKKEFIEAIVDKNYDAWDYDNKLLDSFSERILQGLDHNIFQDSNSVDSVQAIAAFENWDWKERQSKRITFTDTFEFLGFDWWLPFWDKEYMNYWHKVPIKYRFRKRLHINLVDKLYSEMTGIIPSEDYSIVNQTKKIARDIPLMGHVLAAIYKIYGRISYKTQNKTPRIFKDEYKNNPLAGWMSEEVYVYLKKKNIKAFGNFIF